MSKQSGQTSLLEWAVAESTAKQYQRGVMNFLIWVIDNDDGAQSADELDDLLLDYMHDLHGWSA